MTDAQREWARCRPWIEASLEHSPLCADMDTIERRLGDGTYRLFAGENAAALVEIAYYDDVKSAIVRFGGGNLDEILGPGEELVRQYARAHECKLIVFEGRWGWKKPAEKCGYKLAWITMVKEL